jgi:pyruvate formate lyase activating enzyme
MKAVRIFQKGWNFEQDGPGNRLVYHLQGCNLTCPWCSNPEGIAACGVLMVRQEKLTPGVCPHGAIRGQALDRSFCRDCRTRECITLHPNEGIRLSCSDYTIAALMDEVRASKPLFHSGGGVTLSGGEPTVQFDAVQALLQALRTAGVSSAVQTNGTHPQLPELFPLIDTLILDLKHYDDEPMRKLVGQGNKAVMDNLALAAERHSRVWVRLTLIPGFNSSAEDMRQFARLIGALPQEHISVELLPYHDYGRVKWAQCGMEYRMNGAALPRECVAEYESVFRQAGVKVVRT